MKMNMPNKLTILRILLIPVFVFFMLGNTGAAGKWIAGLLFIAASLTDTLDGYLARKNDEITVFGKFMDPLADKLLVCSALICLVQLGRLSAWVVIIIVSREFIISGFRLVAAERGTVIAASPWGKLKTVTQMIMVILLIFYFKGFFRALAKVFVVLATILTVLSLADYIYKNRDVLKDVH